MKNLAIERLRAALDEEYPPGQVTLTAHDARALLALLDGGAAPAQIQPAPPPVHKPWDRARYPGGYHEQLNADYAAQAGENLARMLTVLTESGAGTPDVLDYLRERVSALAPPEKPIQG